MGITFGLPNGCPELCGQAIGIGEELRAWAEDKLSEGGAEGGKEDQVIGQTLLSHRVGSWRRPTKLNGMLN